MVSISFLLLDFSDVSTLIRLVSWVPPIWEPDVREAWLPMGIERPRIPDASHDAVPVHLLQVREADSREESLCVRVSAPGIEGYMRHILRIMVMHRIGFWGTSVILPLGD